MSFSQLILGVREHIGQNQRYAHSVRVARCAALLAQRHGLDSRKARLAGLLHDLARLYSNDRLIAESEARGLPVGTREREHPVLLHAPLGAAIAREKFGIEDDAVLSAIAKHTTGEGEMSPLDCAVYLADSLEPDRSFPERAALWELALRDLTEATRETVRLSAERRARKAAAAEARASAS